MKKPVIICVDDEKIVLDSLKAQLKEALKGDYDIEIAESAEEAIEIIADLKDEQIAIPLIISDQIMPGMKGDELLIKINKILPETRKILLTGQASADAVGNALNKAKLYRYISKPWEATDLILTIKGALKSFFQDIELEKLVIQLQNANENLEAKVEERTKEVIKQKELFEEKNIDLSIANEDIKAKNIQLVEMLDQLTQSKINRKSIIVTLIIGIALTILTEAFLDPVAEGYFESNYVSLGVKVLIALLLKPIDSLYNKWLVKKALQGN